MKTFPQLAASAYAAFCKQASGKNFAIHTPYAQLSAEVQACWVAAVQQVAAEIAAIH